MHLNQPALHAAAKAIFLKFVRAKNLDEGDRRWDRLSDNARQLWLDEAEAAIKVYLNEIGITR